MTRFAKRTAVCLAMVVAACAPGVVAAQQSEPMGWDGQRLSDQPVGAQATFRSVWGSTAADQWAKEHSTALLKAASAAHGVPVSATSVIPDGPPIAADTTYAPLTFTTAHAPVTGDLIDVDQARHLLYVGHGATDTIEVYDVSGPTPKWSTSFNMPGGAAGILIATDIQKLFAGTPNGLAIIDANPDSGAYGTTLNTVYLGPGGTDELDYDPVDKKVYITDVGDKLIGLVNTKPTS